MEGDQKNQRWAVLPCVANRQVKNRGTDPSCVLSEVGGFRGALAAASKASAKDRLKTLLTGPTPGAFVGSLGVIQGAGQGGSGCGY